LTDSNVHTYQIVQPRCQLLSEDACNSRTSLPEKHRTFTFVYYVAWHLSHHSFHHVATVMLALWNVVIM